MTHVIKNTQNSSNYNDEIHLMKNEQLMRENYQSSSLSSQDHINYINNIIALLSSFGYKSCIFCPQHQTIPINDINHAIKLILMFNLQIIPYSNINEIPFPNANYIIIDVPKDPKDSNN